MVSLLASSAIDCGYEPWSCQTKDYKIGICCFSSKNAALRRNSRDWSDFPKLAEKLSVIRTDRHENLVSPKNILPVRKKSPKKFTVTCIMFSLAFLE